MNIHTKIPVSWALNIPRITQGSSCRWISTLRQRTHILYYQKLCYLDIWEIVKINLLWKIIGERTCMTLLKKYLDRENSWNFIILNIAIYLGTSTLIQPRAEQLGQHRDNITEAALKLPALKRLSLRSSEWQQEILVPPLNTFSNWWQFLTSYRQYFNWWNGPRQIVKEEDKIVKESENTTISDCGTEKQTFKCQDYRG